mgnify:CR=1 FL=1
MTARTISPTFVRDEALQSVKDHIEDVYCQLPIVGAHTTPETLERVRAAHRRQGLAIERYAEAQERVDACGCEALRGMTAAMSVGPDVVIQR